jgi:NAD(P)-dependent dehydrogenase (short-subunit alcohol dehydrogenase family)
MATALTLARRGHRIHATMRSPDACPELAEAAAKENLPIAVVAMDVDSDESVRDGVSRILRDGPVDVLVNNAGIERNGTVEETPLSEFRAVMETNYFGAIRCIQAVAPSMRKSGSGCIVNVTSVSGRIAASPLGPYAGSKWALEALSEVLAQEMKAFGVRVAIVEPGIIDTRMAREIEDLATQSAFPKAQRFGRLFAASLANPVRPEVVADRILAIVESDDWTLRHPTGPDAVPFLQWRAAMTDEQWVDFGAMDDEAWHALVQRDFGLDVRPKS